ncbi:hypothetical protein C7E20_10360 [Sphingobium sp. AEW4]|nr:hypothetical protein C7E20_10360 [Sphingobium sp. AEW4]
MLRIESVRCVDPRSSFKNSARDADGYISSRKSGIEPDTSGTNSCTGKTALQRVAILLMKVNIAVSSNLRCREIVSPAKPLINLT